MTNFKSLFLWTSLTRRLNSFRIYLDPELLAEAAHGQRLDAARVGEREGTAQHPLAAEGKAGLLGDVHGFTF